MKSTTKEVEAKHKEQITLALYQRDYELVNRYHPVLLEQIEAAITSGITPDQVKRWAMATVEEAEIVQRIHNAARWYAESLNR